MFNTDYKKERNRIVSFIQNTVRDAGFEKVVIALSGGVDSATTAYLAVEALGRGNVLLVMLPYGDLNKRGVEDAKHVAKKLALANSNIFERDIKAAVDAIAAGDTSMDRERRGNIMARVRMIYLYDLAKKHKAVVCGTENKTEYLLGYFTRFGDEASDLEPLRGLYKTQVVGLARYLKIPQHIIDKKPTAGFWEGQTDEGEFGFSYEEADQILHLIYDKKWSQDDVVKSGLPKDIVEKVLRRARENAFKYDVPYVLGARDDYE